MNEHDVIQIGRITELLRLCVNEFTAMQNRMDDRLHRQAQFNPMQATVEWAMWMAWAQSYGGMLLHLHDQMQKTVDEYRKALRARQEAESGLDTLPWETPE